MNVERKNDEFLPVNDPVSREDQKKDHEPRIGDDCTEISCSLAQAHGLGFTGAARFFEEEQHREEHHEHAQCCHPEYVFHAHVLVNPGSDVWPRSSTDIYQGVVNRVAN